MKKYFNALALLLSVAGLTLPSCGDDDTKPADALITSHRQTGVFYKIDKKTGETTEIFTPTYNGGTLNEVRAFVYHPGTKHFYVSAHSETYVDGVPSGLLYSIDPKTKVATLFNDNDQDNDGNADWYAINNWAVAEDDSLIGVGYFRSGGAYYSGSGILKFGTDGEPASKLLGELDIYEGNGLLFDKGTGIMQVGNGADAIEGEVIISKIDIDNPNVIDVNTSITTFTGFPDDLSATYLYVKAMAKDKNGTVYGILFHYDSGISYFVTIDITGKEITYLSTLGADYDNQYNSLAFIPGEYAK